MQHINMTLASYPGLLDIVKVKKTVVVGESEALRDAYSWADPSGEAVEKREEIRSLLRSAWQSGALNYDMIAKALRIPDISVQALIDEPFIETHQL